MTDDARAHAILAALGPAARRTVGAAESEARALGHDRVGTEHLLLGVLADEASPAASMLRRAGAVLPLARRKVLEVRPALTSPPPDGALELTGRAARALGRSVRFSQGSPEGVTIEHLVMGILDVEGTAGQVLRSLGADVDHVRATLDAGARPARPGAPPAGGAARGAGLGAPPAAGPARPGRPGAPPAAGPARAARAGAPPPEGTRPARAGVAPAEGPARPAARPPRCPACGTAMADDLTWHVVRARGEHGPRDVVVVACGACGATLGAAPT